MSSFVFFVLLVLILLQKYSLFFCAGRCFSFTGQHNHLDHKVASSPTLDNYEAVVDAVVFFLPAPTIKSLLPRVVSAVFVYKTFCRE